MATSTQIATSRTDTNKQAFSAGITKVLIVYADQWNAPTMSLCYSNHQKSINQLEQSTHTVVSPLFSSLRQIWQMTPLIDTLPVSLNDKKRVEQNGEHEGCFPRRLEYVQELLIPISTGVCTHSFVYIGRNNWYK